MIYKWLSMLVSAALIWCGVAGGESRPVFAASQTTNGYQTGDATGSNMSKDEVEKLLREHNRVRSDVGVDPVVWSPAIAEHAQEWADHLADKDCRMEHRPKTGQWAGPYGENLFIGTVGFYGVVDAVRAWESEKRVYDGGPISRSNFMKVGHYTQMIWGDTGEIGCGKAECEGKILIVCNYDPPGNMVGKKPY
jgi:pathogenesis-related protein 1